MRRRNQAEDDTNDNQKEIEEAKRRNSILSCWLFQKFLFTKPWEKILILIGITSAAIAGACLPIIILLFSDLVAIFIQYQFQKEDNKKDNSNPFGPWAKNMHFNFLKDFPMKYDGRNLGELIESCAVKTGILGVVVFLLTFSYAFSLNFVAGQQMKRIRVRYYSGIISQMEDSSKSYYELYVNAQKNLQYFYMSIGDNFGTMIFSFSTFISSLVIAFIGHTSLSGLLIIVFPILFLLMFFGALVHKNLSQQEKNHYLIAENLARDIFLNIHTVKSYEGELSELRRFDKLLTTSQSAAVNTNFFFGAIAGLLYILLYASYALTFWQGISMALTSQTHTETPNILIIVNFCMQISYVNFLKIPIFTWITKKATEAYDNMMKVSFEENDETNKKILEYHVMNDITYSSVSFDYRKTEDDMLLCNVDIRIPPYTLNSIIGPPKTGKTTLLKLLVKLLKPDSGSVKIGKWKVEELNSYWLRSRIGFVQQNSVLFGKTIRETLLMCCENDNCTESDMVNVCRTVNVHTYITSLQQGYDTFLNTNLPNEVLEKLSIARVLMNNPDVLILDDCMTHINLFAQMAIITDFLAQGNKTVISVTRNPEIIKASDFIFHFKDGKVETKTYSKLMETMMESSSVEKNLINFESGETDMRNCHGSMREREHIGLDPNEMVSNGITMSSLPSLNKALLASRKNQESAEKDVNCWKILMLSRKEISYVITACIAAIILGFSVPAYALLFGESLGNLILHSQEEIEDNLHFFPQMFLVAGFISGIARLVEGYMTAISCTKLTKRLRKNTLDSLMQQDIPFFDKPESSMPSLLRLLREDAKLVPLAGAPELLIFTKVCAVIFMSTAFALYTSWKLGLVVLGFSPFLLYGLYYLSRFQSSGVEDIKFKESNIFIEELLRTKETVQLLSLKDYFIEHYKKTLFKINSPLTEKLVAKSLLFAYSQSMPFFAYACCMFYGGMLLQENEISFTTFFKIIEALILGTLLVSQVIMIIPSRKPCLKSYARLLSVDPLSFQRSRTLLRSRFEMANWISTGFIKMKHVGFVHPYFHLVPELRDVNIQVNEKQMVVAFTGAINSGYSIPLKLILQFYKPTSGSVVVDELDINREFSSRTLRRSTGYVNGNDRFFRRTVARNIAYSTFNTIEGYEAYVGMDEIINAAQEADVHNFISTLSDGYYTIMTDEVCKKMTPGQILRLSLARALLRDPKILLIDNIGIEIDEDAQQLMENAIARSCFMRTVVLTSHHLLSVSSLADCIYFFKNGSIVEFGKHQKLMEKKGAYYRLYEQQREQLRKIREGQHMTAIENL